MSFQRVERLRIRESEQRTAGQKNVTWNMKGVVSKKKWLDRMLQNVKILRHCYFLLLFPYSKCCSHDATDISSFQRLFPEFPFHGNGEVSTETEKHLGIIILSTATYLFVFRVYLGLWPFIFHNTVGFLKKTAVINIKVTTLTDKDNTSKVKFIHQSIRLTLGVKWITPLCLFVLSQN